MSWTTVGELMLLLGAVLTLLAAVGMCRFQDVFARMHALSKASTLAVLLMIAGAAVVLTHRNDITSLILAGVLQLLTTPLAANMLSVTTFRAEGIDVPLDTVDAAHDDTVGNAHGEAPGR